MVFYYSCQRTKKYLHPNRNMEAEMNALSSLFETLPLTYLMLNLPQILGNNQWGQCGNGDDSRAHVYDMERVNLGDDVGGSHGPHRAISVRLGLQHALCLREVSEYQQ